MLQLYIFVFFVFRGCNAVIYSINSTEYDRMPPLFGLDEYATCLRRDDGLYCMLRLDLHAEPTNELINLIRGYSDHTVKHYNHTYIQRGVCVPTTCREYIARKTEKTRTESDLNELLEGCLDESIWRGYGIHAKLTAVYYCDRPNEGTSYDLGDGIVAVCFFIIIAVNVSASYYDNLLRSTTGKTIWKDNQYLLSFSLFKNWEWLTSYEPSDPRLERLKGLHCVKCIITFFIVMAHCTWINVQFTDNPLDFEKAYDTLYYQVIHGGMMMVQMFLVLSSFLTIYNLLIRSETTIITRWMYLKIVLLRFWRLTPSNAAMLAVSATWLRHAGAGPLWQPVAGVAAAACRRHWWQHLLFFNNYVREDKHCAIQTWYLAAEFQLFLLGLAVYIATRNRNRNVVLTLLLLLGLTLPALHVWALDLDGVVIMSPEFFRTNDNVTFWLSHIAGHTNLTCYVIGMSTAHLVHHLQRTGADFTGNKILRELCWWVVPVIVGLFASCRMFYADCARASLATRMLFATMHRVAMSAITGFIIVALVMRFNEPISRACEWRGWAAPARLGYGVFLAHVALVHVLVGGRTQLAHVSMYNLAVVTLGVTAMSLLVALPLHLLVEAPVSRLIQVIATKDLESAPAIKTS